MKGVLLCLHLLAAIIVGCSGSDSSEYTTPLPTEPGVYILSPAAETVIVRECHWQIIEQESDCQAQWESFAETLRVNVYANIPTGIRRARLLYRALAPLSYGEWTSPMSDQFTLSVVLDPDFYPLCPFWPLAGSDSVDNFLSVEVESIAQATWASQILHLLRVRLAVPFQTSSSPSALEYSAFSHELKWCDVCPFTEYYNVRIWNSLGQLAYGADSLMVWDAQHVNYHLDARWSVDLLSGHDYRAVVYAGNRLGLSAPSDTLYFTL
jgi:hypothetical protein